jgi:hypothetical protein
MRCAFVTLALAGVLAGCAKNEEEPTSVVPPKRQFVLIHAITVKSKHFESKDGTTKIDFSFDWDGTLWQVAMVEGPFDPKAHKVDQQDGKILIDGKTEYGAVFYPPNTEIKSIQLKVGGKAIDVPKDLYSDLFNFGLDHRETTDFGNVYGFVARALPDGTLLLSAFGSDAEGSYLVHWWLGGLQPPTRQVVTSTRDLFRFADDFNTFEPERPPNP